MSYLDHMCKPCSHQKLWHVAGSCSNGSCRCDQHTAVYGGPVLITTYSPTGRPNTNVTTPGDWVFYPNTHTCACRECLAAHTTLAAGGNDAA